MSVTAKLAAAAVATLALAAGAAGPASAATHHGASSAPSKNLYCC